MDDEINVSQQEIDQLTAGEKVQLQTFLQTEAQKSSIQKTVHELTEVCFKKCISGSISSGKLASKEESCMSNCVNRFMDSNLAVLKHLETLRANQ
ncbi:Mitochondrial import inner membrane translocase subunit tim8 [Elasticomyces elasticus]|uniref:Mitochondrial import inner membrane translocase subunit n=1 Tax=Exophiala sideris TaxID=1016849 RepID=A0A0D1WQZ0_9EURO|nr:Mitochondrial import inner membrane translocase subunit tim8 [Elasticomyces elasticus]KAK5029508.1 Mitochondrial import inner membrane translocase subunit tim8 [Exophiala sideris]KAK5182097.1 Mitochondrial import inner membrane translocase subunit tim8 [Eurotiomycetes sp. CCFEE 6388]KAK5036795.1 Mitochondrial import inner membrane translocase subunit tim8 [Exophiala sideris]KAK5058137.1 Mitochondrial import inner membrane translocase subunit tim8 [Exophiala sideris]